MKQGEQIKCPFCKKDRFLKKDSIMDGWTKKGEALFCALCAKKIEDIVDEKAVAQQEARKAGDKLSALFGGESLKAAPKIEEADKKFCRDCAWLIAHPFLSRCDLHQKTVNPMDDCPDFKPKQTVSGKDIKL